MTDDSISTSPTYDAFWNSKPFELRFHASTTFDKDNTKAGSSILYDNDNGEHVQQGVKEAEAIAQTWTRQALVISYFLILCVFFVDSLEQQISSTLLPYVYSSFSAHSLVTTASIMSSIIGAVVKLPIAKMIDIWGRPQGYLVMIVVATIGLILLAACKNVETYAAAQVFFWVGFNGIGYVLDVFIADTSALRNRGLIFAFTTTPYMATTFAGPAAAQRFLDHSSWRWAYGAFAVVVPLVTAPVALIFLVNRQKAAAEGKIEKPARGKTWGEAVRYYLVEFDVVGMLLICAGFALLILPLTLAAYQPDQWRDPAIICMLVFGAISLALFYVWEKWFAPVRFLPFHLLTDRSIWGACGCACVSFIAYYCWDYYFTSYLQVVHHLSVSQAGYVGNIYNIGSCFWAIPVGLAIRQTNRFKWCALISVPWMILGTGLMCHFRADRAYGLGPIIMCQIFIAFAGGTLVICEEMAVMAAVSAAAQASSTKSTKTDDSTTPGNSSTNGSVAVPLALLSLFSGIGAAVGLGVSGAIWTSVFPTKLREYLPAGSEDEVARLYASLVEQLLEPEGSAVRVAVERAYGAAQQRMCIVATCVLVLAVPCVLVVRDWDLREVRKRVSGGEGARAGDA